jgi:hypothetical protein
MAAQRDVPALMKVSTGEGVDGGETVTKKPAAIPQQLELTRSLGQRLARAYAKRVLRLRIAAVKNSMKRRLAPLAHDADNRRQRLKPGTDQYGGAYYFVGQHDPVMASTIH